MNTEKLKNYKIFEDLSNENINLFVDVLEEVKVDKGENFISDRRTANVKAKSNCTLGKVTKENLFSICDKNPDVGYKIMRNLGRIISGNLVNANQNVLKLTTAFSLILDR